MFSPRVIRSAAIRAAGAAVLAGAMVITGSPVGETAVASAAPTVVAPGVPMPTGGGWGHLHGHGGWGHGKWGKAGRGHGWVNGGRINGFIRSGGRGGW